MNVSENTLYDESPGEVGVVEWHDYVCPEPFYFEHGQSIPQFTIRYETYGRLNKERNNVILICHALSGDHHCAGVHSINDRKTGWWNHVVGPNKPIDTRKWFVVSSNCIGGCVGSTGPSSINPETGKRYNLNFPVITIRDMVNAQKKLLDHLGVAELYTVIGGSMGGMQVLQWAIDYPDFVKRIIALATTARQGAQAIAFNEVGRSAIMQDPEWKNGEYDENGGPDVGLAVARMMAHITYLSDKGMDVKFGRTKKEDWDAHNLFDAEFEVESYLRYQGQSFINRFDANTYLYFTKALDRFDLYGQKNSLEEAFTPMKARALVVGFKSDWLFPPEQNRNYVHAMLRCGKMATYAELDMDLGHDSFLVHAPALYDLISSFLNSKT